MLQLLLVQVPQLVDIGRLSRRNTLCELDEPASPGALADAVLRSYSLDLDNTHTWVVGATVVLAVAEVADPRLEGGRVVLVYGVAVGDDAGLASDRGPLTIVVEEAEVDVRV